MNEKKTEFVYHDGIQIQIHPDGSKTTLMQLPEGGSGLYSITEDSEGKVTNITTIQADIGQTVIEASQADKDVA